MLSLLLEGDRRENSRIAVTANVQGSFEKNGCKSNLSQSLGIVAKAKKGVDVPQGFSSKYVRKTIEMLMCAPVPRLEDLL